MAMKDEELDKEVSQLSLYYDTFNACDYVSMPTTWQITRSTAPSNGLESEHKVVEIVFGELPERNEPAVPLTWRSNKPRPAPKEMTPPTVRPRHEFNEVSGPTMNNIGAASRTGERNARVSFAGGYEREASCISIMTGDNLIERMWSMKKIYLVSVLLFCGWLCCQMRALAMKRCITFLTEWNSGRPANSSYATKGKNPTW